MKLYVKFVFVAWAACILLLQPAALAHEQVVPESRELLELTYAPLVSQVAPAVVNIFSRRRKEQAGISPLFRDPFFRRLFREFGLKRPTPRMQSSLGSGVIVQKEGLVVTNNHVISEADEIIVSLADRREFKAQVVLADERTDLAVLRISAEGENLPTIKLMNSDDLQVGDPVLAIGNPFGVGQTVTSGIVSALARTRVGVSDFQFFIQTDAAINPGNSGGALVTMKGRLAGVNTAIFSRSGGSIGIGFAIPSNMVGSVINAAITGGRIARPWIGAAGIAVDAEIASRLGLDRPQGVLLQRVLVGGPTDQVGLRIGDVLLSFNGEPVDDPHALSYRIALSKLGTEALLEVWRMGEVLSFTMPLTAAPELPARNVTEIKGQGPLAGARVANLSPALAEELGLDSMAYSDGVIILSIARMSPAYRVRLRPGDVIREVNHHKVETVAALIEKLDEGEVRRIQFRRGDREFGLTIRE